MKPAEEEGLVTLMVGLAVGVFAGLLCAPRSGRETRRELRRGAEASLDYISEKAERIHDSAERLAHSTNKWLASLKDSAWSGKEDVEPKLEDLPR